MTTTEQYPEDCPGPDEAHFRGAALGLLVVLCAAMFLDALDVSMMAVALPSIRRSLHMSTTALQWVVSGYVLGYGGFLLLGGRDHRGVERLHFAERSVGQLHGPAALDPRLQPGAGHGVVEHHDRGVLGSQPPHRHPQRGVVTCLTGT